MTKEERVSIYYAGVDWKRPDGTLTRWRLVAEFHDRKTGMWGLGWLYTYTPKLTTLGMAYAEFYRDSSYRLCIRTK